MRNFMRFKIKKSFSQTSIFKEKRRQRDQKKKKNKIKFLMKKIAFETHSKQI